MLRAYLWKFLFMYVYVQLKLKRRNLSHNATKFNKVKLAIILAEENTKYFGMR